MDIKKDLSFFNKNILIQVCFGLYQVQLNFVRSEGGKYHYENLHIEVGSNLEYKKADGSIYKWNSDNSRASNFCINSLMEISVIDALFDANNDLCLKFENGESLRVISAHGPFESYVVHYQTDFEVIGFDPLEL